MPNKLIIYTDGGARGNPGPAGVGAVIRSDHDKIVSLHKAYIGEATNNIAEYKALILALSEAVKLDAREIIIRMDSELVVRQMQGKYKIKEPSLQKLAAEVFKLMNKFIRVNFQHVPREKNKLADELVNKAIDEFFA